MQNMTLPVARRSVPSPSQLSRLLCWLGTGRSSWVVLVPLDRLSVGGTGCSSGSDAGAWTIAGVSRGAEVTYKERRGQISQEGERPWAILLFLPYCGLTSVVSSPAELVSDSVHPHCLAMDPRIQDNGYCNTMCPSLDIPT